MLTLATTTQFRKDVKRMKKRGVKLEKLNFLIDKLLKEEVLDPKYRDHALVGNYIGFRECHIEPDWLLIYKVDKGQLILTASRTGSHSDLF
ncbi:MAG: type II toxin-antitoxin system YafQ family toxin [Gemella sp.]|nr:type II toxin-antitoxin system YafQ family toxin [Gemella sp.]